MTGLGKGNAAWDSHAWNLVQLDGKWYHVDVTWDEAGGHLYFLKSDDFINEAMPGPMISTQRRKPTTNQTIRKVIACIIL